jgi:hypothetical protein
VSADAHRQRFAGVLVDDVRELKRRWSAVSSNWKSIAHTWFGRNARSRSLLSGRTRRRFQGRDGGRFRPSARHNRGTRLRFTDQPSRRPIRATIL